MADVQSHSAQQSQSSQHSHTARVEQLLALLQAGDAAAQGQLIEHACQRLEILTQRMLKRFPHVRRWEETGDIFSQAVARLHRSLASVRPTSARHFYNLAAAQIRRVLIDVARKHFGPEGIGANHESAMMSGSVDGGPRPAAEAVDATEPADLLAWTEFHQQVERLPEEEREAFGLLWYGGLSQEEAAHVLGTSVRTVKRRWQSVRFLLGKSLQGESP